MGLQNRSKIDPKINQEFDVIMVSFLMLLGFLLASPSNPLGHPNRRKFSPRGPSREAPPQSREKTSKEKKRGREKREEFEDEEEEVEEKDEKEERSKKRERERERDGETKKSSTAGLGPILFPKALRAKGSRLVVQGVWG